MKLKRWFGDDLLFEKLRQMRLSKDAIMTDLFIEIQKFREWAETVEIKLGEWEVNYDDDRWGAIYASFEDFILDTDCLHWNKDTIEDILYILARDWKMGILARNIAKYEALLVFLAEQALSSGEEDAKWQLVAHLPSCSDTNTAERLLLAFIRDDDEYTNRRALLALAKIQSPKTEEYCKIAWDRNIYGEMDEYQKMAALEALFAVHSKLLPQYITLAKEDGREYLPNCALKIEAKVFYTVLVEGSAESEDFVQVFFTWADNIGEAIGKITAVAREDEHIDKAWSSEADTYDYDTLPDEVMEIGHTAVYSSGARIFFPADESVFRIPAGVILSCVEGEFDPEELSSGFRCYEDGELLCIDCAVPDGKLEKVFNTLASVLPDIRVSWVEFSDEWDDVATRQFYANEALNSPKLVREFLHREVNNIVRNGMVAFTVYSDGGQTNLLISENKIIRVLTYSKDVLDAMAIKLQALGFASSDTLKTVAHGLHHWHYTPVGALSRTDCIAHLLERGFLLWKEIPANKE